MKLRNITAAAVIAVVCAVSFAESASAVFPGRAGLVAYVLPSGSHLDIWTINPANGATVRLTTQGKNNFPRWSADGKRIAFNNSGNLWIMNADGSGQKKITKTGKDLKPSWSPDGKQLVFIRKQSNGAGDLFRVPVAGGSAVRLTNDAATAGGNDRPSWSPDGKLILFDQYNADGHSIRTVSSTGGAEQVIPAAEKTSDQDAGYEPDWAADGNVIFMAYCDLNEFGGCVPSPNVWYATLTGSARTAITTYDGYDSSPQLEDYAISPSTTGPNKYSVAFVGGEDYDIRMDQFGFEGLDVGGYRVSSAVHPDWQAIP